MTLIRKAREYARRLWVRVSIMGLLAFVALGLTQLIEPLVPEEIATSLTGSAADRLLQIIANAMLSVTIFSLTVMVTVYRSSSTQWTPRVHRLIIQDRTTQNTLAVFIGAYVYALLAIILRELGVYVDERALVLFAMTVIVLVVIVVYLIRWVLHLQTFGSLIDTTRQIEDVTRAQFRDRLENPCLGANALTQEVPEAAEAVCASQSGYIQHIYPEALNNLAKAKGLDFYMTRNIGHFVFLNEPLMMVVRREDAEGDAPDMETLAEDIRECIVMGDLRTYDQDPRFGLVVMGEVASKALSPGVNDPGTAIDVITRIGRILSDYSDEVGRDRETKLKHLYVRPLDPRDLIDDGFGALARDGRSVVEVQQRLQAILSGLMRHPDEGLSRAARAAAEDFLRRTLHAIDFDPDRKRVMSSAREDVQDAVGRAIAGAE
ncbi:DUF2254 domain-containing protein [Marimonas sp. MJW-29]|uniref:DUF2254 domain-containing protein n=1 Tax=Sulfitobacter sediminis TaxID=3234186 RepID=A0ABV3RP25_9RHOB